jgi:hypothetical protein
MIILDIMPVGRKIALQSKNSELLWKFDVKKMP